MEIKKLGSVYFDGVPQEICNTYNGGRISFGPAVPGMEIEWVSINNLLIATSCVCCNISWEQLDNQGLVFGIPVQIGEEFYLCRCLKVGAKEGASKDEWEDAVNATTEDDRLWHWQNQYFWGQERTQADRRAVRGGNTAHYWGNCSKSYRDFHIGFRPTFEYLGCSNQKPKDLEGKVVKLYGSDGITLTGKLLGFDDYDLVLGIGSPLPPMCPWLQRDGKSAIIDQAKILWLKEEE